MITYGRLYPDQHRKVGVPVRTLTMSADLAIVERRAVRKYGREHGRLRWAGGMVRGSDKVLRPDFLDLPERRVRGLGHGLCDLPGVHLVGGFGGDEGGRGGYVAEGEIKVVGGDKPINPPFPHLILFQRV